jgi:hypothetical protein
MGHLGSVVETVYSKECTFTVLLLMNDQAAEYLLVCAQVELILDW